MAEEKYFVSDAESANFKIRVLLDLDETPEILRDGRYSLNDLVAAISHLPKISGTSDFVNMLIESEAVEGHRISLRGPEYRARVSEVSKRMWKDPEHKARMSEVRREIWNDPERRARISEASRTRWKDPKYKARMSEACKEMSELKTSIRLIYNQRDPQENLT